MNAGSADACKVFVIHGRNELARRGMFVFLRSLALRPIEWSQAIDMTGQGSPYISEVLNAAFGAAQAVVVLQTPDDVAYLHESLAEANDPECLPQMQPHPNVLFEAGMAMGRHPERTIIVELGTVKSFSDIHGRHVVRLDNSVEKRQALAQRLAATGCAVELRGIEWHTAGDLTPPNGPRASLPGGGTLLSADTRSSRRSTASLDTPWNGADLRQRRHQAGVTQAELARAVGLMQHAIDGWESGRAVPDVVTWRKVLDYLGTVELGHSPPSAVENSRLGEE